MLGTGTCASSGPPAARALLALLALASCDAVTARPPAGGGAAQDEGLRAFATRVAALPLDGDPATLRGTLPAGVALDGDAGSWQLRFDPPVDAAVLCRAWGWARPFAISPDVHQRGWIVALHERELEDPHGRRIATRAPRLGAWQARAQLGGRPQGPLPGVAAGASPAYDLAEQPAAVVRVIFHPPR
jgi:hypothetical protein